MKVLKKVLNYLLDEFKDAYKGNYKFIIFLLVFVLVLTFPLPYYVLISGGITDLSDRFIIENGYSQKGSYNLSYVNRAEGNVLTYIISHIMSDWQLESVSDYQYSNESFEELEIRDSLSLQRANQIATIIAYTKAKEINKDIKIETNGVSIYVYLVNDTISMTNKIKVGDKLLKIDRVEITNTDQVIAGFKDKVKGDEITLELQNDDDIYESTIKYLEDDEVPMSFIPIYDLEVSPKIKFTFKSTESGPSAGFMTTLAIYDALIEEDLTNGYKIAGTGTISGNGEVGPIGGVEYKISGAEKDGAKIFFVPKGENYEDALKKKKENNYDIELVEISTFDEAVEYLEKMKSEKE